MEKYPKVKSVQIVPDKKLRIVFANDVIKIYDCSPLLNEMCFSLLNDDALFRNAHPDPGGYGVIWNDDIDLAESELWLNGITILHSSLDC